MVVACNANWPKLGDLANVYSLIKWPNSTLPPFQGYNCIPWWKYIDAIIPRGSQIRACENRSLGLTIRVAYNKLGMVVGSLSSRKFWIIWQVVNCINSSHGGIEYYWRRVGIQLVQLRSVHVESRPGIRTCRRRINVEFTSVEHWSGRFYVGYTSHARPLATS